jgi:Kef-type K+ transport system membrane component KefB
MESNPAVALFLALGLIIAASRIGGSLARRVGQPRVLGELIVGVLLGPTLLDMLHLGIFHGVPLEETIKELAEIGVLLLMFLIGLEVNLSELAKVGRVAVFGGILGVIVPVAMTMPLMMYVFDYGWQPSLFAGVTLAATSVSISAQVLLELGYLRTEEGNALLATALIDDILAILLVSITIAVIGTSGVAEAEAGGEAVSLMGIVLIVLRMLGYIVGAFLLAWFVVPRFMNWLAQNPVASQSYGIPAVALVLAFLFGWTAEEIGGVATITGSFIAGVGLSQTKERVKSDIEHSISHIAYAFLVPVFFIDVGLETDLSVFPLSALPFASALLAVAIISKVGGAGLGGLMGGFNMGKSTRLGVCMISRGEVGLIIASLGVSVGVFTQDDPLFGSIFLVILLTTLVTPILVRWVFAGHESNVVHNGHQAPKGAS